LDASSKDFEQVLRADQQTCAEWFAGRAVFIANARTGADMRRKTPGTEERAPTPDGRILPAFVANAVALDSLLSGKSLRRPSHVRLPSGLYVNGRYLYESIAVLIAAAIALSILRRSWRWVALIAAVALLLASSLFLYRYAYM